MIKEEDVYSRIYEFLRAKNKILLKKKELQKFRLLDTELDSIEIVELIVFLEKAFNFEFDDYTLIYTRKHDFTGIADYVCSKCNT